ncbi:unnamed protein product, partial [Musa hybrid cultivar]
MIIEFKHCVLTATCGCHHQRYPPYTRISVDGILRDPWFARDIDLDQLLALVPPNSSKIHRRIGGASDRERFTSSEPTDRIMDRVEEVGETEGLA